MIRNESTFHGRVVLIGDSLVGKTSILNMLVEHKFNPTEQSTVGANYQLYINSIYDTRVEIQIWDTAGQEKYKSLGPIYYRNSCGALAVYDSTSKISFENLDSWIEAFICVAGPDAVVAVIANKCDLEEQSTITEAEALEYTEKHGFLYFKTSARTGEGINEMFDKIVTEIVKKDSPKEKPITITKANEDSCAC